MSGRPSNQLEEATLEMQEIRDISIFKPNAQSRECSIGKPHLQKLSNLTTWVGQKTSGRRQSSQLAPILHEDSTPKVESCEPEGSKMGQNGGNSVTVPCEDDQCCPLQRCVSSKQANLQPPLRNITASAGWSCTHANRIVCWTTNVIYPGFVTWVHSGSGCWMPRINHKIEVTHYNRPVLVLQFVGSTS